MRFRTAIIPRNRQVKSPSICKSLHTSRNRLSIVTTQLSVCDYTHATFVRKYIQKSQSINRNQSISSNHTRRELTWLVTPLDRTWTFRPTLYTHILVIRDRYDERRSLFGTRKPKFSRISIRLYVDRTFVLTIDNIAHTRIVFLYSWCIKRKSVSYRRY